MKKQVAILVCLSFFFTHFDTFAIQPEINRMQRLKLQLSHEYNEFMKCIKSDQNCDKKREQIYIVTSYLLLILGAYLFTWRQVTQENRRIQAQHQARRLQQSQQVQHELFLERDVPHYELVKQVIQKWDNIGRLVMDLFGELNPNSFAPDRRGEVFTIRKEINNKPELKAYFDRSVYLLSGRSESQVKEDLQKAIEVENFLQEKQQQVERLRLR